MKQDTLEGKAKTKNGVKRPMSLSYHRQADLAFAQKQVEG